SSASVPGRKVTVICSTPSEPATDLVYIMSSTPLIASSSGVATVSAITLGLAPGYTAVTTTDGGTTSGYSPIGSSGIEISPAAKITIDSTAAKIGRSMKNLEKSMMLLLACLAYFIATACAGDGVDAAAPMAISRGATGIPGMNTFCTPCTITLSSAARPDSTTRSPSIIRPSTTSLRSALLPSPST